MSQNFRSSREHYGDAVLLKSAISSWIIVGFAIFVFAGFLVVHGIADTSAYGPRIRNPVHNAQCSASNTLTLDSRCPGEESQRESKDH
jgi:hypothetical protein